MKWVCPFLSGRSQAAIRQYFCARQASRPGNVIRCRNCGRRTCRASCPLRRKQEGKWILEKFSNRSLIYLCDIFFLSDKNGHTQIHHSSRRYIPKGTGGDKTGGLGVQRRNGHFKTRRYRTEKCAAAAFKALSVVIRQDHWKMLPLSAMRRVCVMAKKSDLTNSLPGEIRGGQCQQFHIGRQPYPLESGR